MAYSLLQSMDPRNISLRDVVCETWLITTLTLELLYDLGARLIWIWMFFRFLLYVSLLMVPFIRAGWVFLTSDYIKRGIKYGPNPRNLLDIYLASDIMTRLETPNPCEATVVTTPRKARQVSSHDLDLGNKYPVVVFLTGGAWMIGYKAWGAFMGMLLAQLGIIFVAPDYRNFPQGTISDSVTDATNAVQWTMDNIEEYGGDKNNIYVISQSAGAHIGALMMLLQAQKVAMYQKLKSHLGHLKRNRRRFGVHIMKSHVTSTTTTGDSERVKSLDDQIRSVEDHLNSSEFDALWDPERDVKAFIGIAGPYNLQDMKLYLDQRGLYSDILYSIMEHDLRRWSPFYCLYDRFISPRDNQRVLKPMHKIGRIDSNDPDVHFVSMTEINVDAVKVAVNPDEAETKVDRKDVRSEGGEEGMMTLNQVLAQKVELKLPSTYLFHGADDMSCPVSNTKTFSLALANYGVKTYIRIYPNQTHTSPIIENPISGKDPLCQDILQIIYPQQSLNDIVQDIEETMTGGLRIPQWVLDLATFVCPF